MIYNDYVTIERVALHHVGNKSADEGIILSKSQLSLSQKLKELLSQYFLTPFKMDEYYHFFHDSNLNLNEVFVYASQIFENPDSLYDNSVSLAKHLYEQSTHPNIKGGDFYTVYLKNCNLDGEELDAIGLFKSENKDTYLKVLSDDDNFFLESDLGINIKKLDKGCLIFNTEKEQGYTIAVIDNTNRTSEAQYWVDDFLHVTYRQDDYHYTQNLMALTKSFVLHEMPEQFEVSKAEQAAILNDSIAFFKEKENFTMEEFHDEVIQQPEIVESFQQYRQRFALDNDIRIPDTFDISESAVKKQSRGFKSVIKLDKNFHIYIHGNQNLIEQGEDEKGKFYKVYYKEES